MLDCISIKWPFVPATQRLEIHKQLTQTNPRRASVLGVSVIRKRLIAVPALTCAAAINTDIKIDAGRHPALTPLLFSFLSLHSLPPFFPSSPVPTIAPRSVQAEPVNSTTIRFTWTAPNPQFINGINQGYKVSDCLRRPPSPAAAHHAH